MDNAYTPIQRSLLYPSILLIPLLAALIIAPQLFALNRFVGEGYLRMQIILSLGVLGVGSILFLVGKLSDVKRGISQDSFAIKEKSVVLVTLLYSVFYFFITLSGSSGAALFFDLLTPGSIALALNEPFSFLGGPAGGGYFNQYNYLANLCFLFIATAAASFKWSKGLKLLGCAALMFFCIIVLGTFVFSGIL